MSLETIKNRLPDFARDLKLNLSSIANVTSLTPQQLWGTAVATAIASRNADLVRSIEAEAGDKLAPQARTAAHAAAAIMAMNNIYYRFNHLVSDKEFSKMPAKLRMNVIGSPGIAKADFEMMSLAVSAINGCGMCMDAHVHEVVKAGISKTGVQSAVRIAAVINAAAQAIAISDMEAQAGQLAA